MPNIWPSKEPFYYTDVCDVHAHTLQSEKLDCIRSRDTQVLQRKLRASVDGVQTFDNRAPPSVVKERKAARKRILPSPDVFAQKPNKRKPGLVAEPPIPTWKKRLYDEFAWSMEESDSNWEEYNRYRFGEDWEKDDQDSLQEVFFHNPGGGYSNLMGF